MNTPEVTGDVGVRGVVHVEALVNDVVLQGIAGLTLPRTRYTRYTRGLCYAEAPSEVGYPTYCADLGSTK